MSQVTYHCHYCNEIVLVEVVNDAIVPNPTKYVVATNNLIYHPVCYDHMLPHGGTSSATTSS